MVLLMDSKDAFETEKLVVLAAYISLGLGIINVCLVLFLGLTLLKGLV